MANRVVSRGAPFAGHAGGHNVVVALLPQPPSNEHLIHNLGLSRPHCSPTNKTWLNPGSPLAAIISAVINPLSSQDYTGQQKPPSLLHGSCPKRGLDNRSLDHPPHAAAVHPCFLTLVLPPLHAGLDPSLEFGPGHLVAARPSLSQPRTRTRTRTHTLHTPLLGYTSHDQARAKHPLSCSSSTRRRRHTPC